MPRAYPLEHYATLTISSDKLKAFLRFNNLEEDFSCSYAELGELLKAHSIQHGVQVAVMAHIVSDPKYYTYNEGLIASGDAPKDGNDGSISFLYDMENKGRKPAEHIDGTVDYKELVNLKNVLKGQLIAERIPAEDMIPGKAVTGEQLFGKKGKEARFKVGKNVVIDGEQIKMYAAIDGIIAKTDRDKVNVFPVFEVNGDIDYNVGNIDFVGTVVIRGNILSGFRVKAAGDIRVIGGVEGAEVEAGGSIEIGAGILGNNKGFVKAGASIKTTFIQEGIVEAGENVNVSQSIMHSHVRARLSVICQGTKGLIVGGTIQAGERVVARTIGNPMSTQTNIEVGVMPELRNELQQLRGTLKSCSENLDKTEKALILLDQMAAAGTLTPDKLALRIKLVHTKRQGLEEVIELRQKVLEIEKTLDETENGSVDVMATIYGGAKIVIGRYTKFIKDPCQRVSFRYVAGDIAMVSN